MARVAFFQNLFIEYLGIMYLASILKKRGDEVAVFIGTSCHHLVSQIEHYHPDIVAFSCMTGSHEFALGIAKEVKSRIDTLALFGGPHPTFFPEIINEEGVDIVCRGEGEEALLELVEAIDGRRSITAIPNLWVKQDREIIKNEMRPLIQNLDKLPFPDRHIYYYDYPFMNNSRKIFMAGRGCPYKCSYCFNETLRELYKEKGTYVRMRSADNVISEIEEVRQRYKLSTVYMLDDTFIVNKLWLFEFLEKYRSKINIPFICLVRADLISDEIAQNLKAAGCHSVFFGVESGDEYIRNTILNRKMTNEQIINTAALLKKHKIKFRTYNMMGIPGEDVRQGFMTVDLNIKIKTDYPWCSILQPYPKTAIEDYIRKHGIQKKDGIPQYFFKKSILDSPYIRELSNLQKLFYFAVKLPFLKPVVRILIKLPPNPMFEVLFLIGYAYSYYKSERLSLKEVVDMGLHNIMSFVTPIILRTKSQETL